MGASIKVQRWTVPAHGFAIVPGVFTSFEMDAIATHLDTAGHRRSRAGIRHLMRDQAVRCIAEDARMLQLARAALGNSAFAFHATLFDKSPDANWLVVWHQDTALPLREKHEVPGWGSWSVKNGTAYAHAPASALEQILAIRVHLDDSNLDNGPLRVLPGTHDQGVLTDDEIHQLSTRIEPVDCTIAKGGVALMRPLAVHASSKSLVAHSRRILHIEYAALTSFDGLHLAVA